MPHTAADLVFERLTVEARNDARPERDRHLTRYARAAAESLDLDPDTAIGVCPRCGGFENDDAMLECLLCAGRGTLTIGRLVALGKSLASYRWPYETGDGSDWRESGSGVGYEFQRRLLGELMARAADD